MKYVLWMCAFILSYGTMGAVEIDRITLKQGIVQIVIAVVIAFMGYVLHVKDERDLDRTEVRRDDGKGID